MTAVNWRKRKVKKEGRELGIGSDDCRGLEEKEDNKEGRE
jgi:hypothetical protein